MACAPNALHGRRDGACGVDLTNQIDEAYIDTQLKRSGGNERANFARLELALCFQAEPPRKRAMMRGNIFCADALTQLECHTLSKGALIHKDKCRAMFADQFGEPLVD